MRPRRARLREFILPPLAVIRMKLVVPQERIIQPFILRKPQQAFDLQADIKLMNIKNQAATRRVTTGICSTSASVPAAPPATIALESHHPARAIHQLPPMHPWTDQARPRPFAAKWPPPPRSPSPDQPARAYSHLTAKKSIPSIAWRPTPPWQPKGSRQQTHHKSPAKKQAKGKMNPKIEILEFVSYFEFRSFCVLYFICSVQTSAHAALPATCRRQDTYAPRTAGTDQSSAPPA